ncbi:hypothetical protein [Mycolicibacterium sp.]|uniref:Rv1733c family protein n=1 Tax=Mycolicibacterium sp. TaxID=2320850 RepID=UPI001A17FEC1|nr:hypothetical protein [Mycolicibacterium sp.]MBJ7337057.1 hypothetical protein [Mycolicibacterium sp.]
MAITLFAGRLRWHLRALGFNPLIRVSDRLEALAVLGVLVVALLSVPLAARAADQVYDAGMRTAAEQSHSRHSVDAMAIDGRATLPADFQGSDYVRVQWREGTTLHTDRVVTPAPVMAGEALTIWLNDTGKVVAAPLTPEDAELSALGAGGTVWATIVACSALIAFVIRRRLDRSRLRAWERELHLMAHNDDGWANRYP